MQKDWTGNHKSIYTPLGASNHTEAEREQNDYYATDPTAIDKLLKIREPMREIWEPACGQGHLSKRLEKHGFIVKSTDLYDRGFGQSGIDFLKNKTIFDGDIITNPPYKYATEFVLKALESVPSGNSVYMFLKLQFLEGKARKKLIFDKHPPSHIYIFSERIACAKNGDFEGMKQSGGSAVAYAWFVWEAGKKNWVGPEIRWI